VVFHAEIVGGVSKGGKNRDVPSVCHPMSEASWDLLSLRIARPLSASAGHAYQNAALAGASP
jgi:hypothetical protein